jgi:hypothetical protein
LIEEERQSVQQYEDFMADNEPAAKPIATADDLQKKLKNSLQKRFKNRLNNSTVS